MLVRFLLVSLFILFNYSNVFLFCILLFIILTFFLVSLKIEFLSSLSDTFFFITYDEVSLFINILLFFIIFISYLSRNYFKHYKIISFVLLRLLFFCLQVFSTTHLFILYLNYEASLLPILFIIIKWGSYPERSSSALIILTYTLVFSIPFFFIILYVFNLSNTWYIDFIKLESLSFIFSLFIFLCFAVKLPIYGIHYWLPIAHVEAPTFGSVILARILLKLGGVSLLRLLNLIDLSSLNSYLLSYFIIFTVFSTLICCFQSDFKRLIAYSSVSHIIVIPFLIFSSNLLSFKSTIIIILFHGLRSSLIFLRVGVLYFIFSSRLLIIIRGLILISPLFSFLLILTFFYTLSAPPFPSYVAEVFFIIRSFYLSNKILLVFLPFVFLGLVYNINWLRAILFSSVSNSVFSEFFIKYNTLLPFFLIFIYTFILLFSFMYF